MKLLEHVRIHNGEATPPARKRHVRALWLTAAALLVVVALAAAFVIRARFAPETTYVTQSVLRQDLVQTVTATGVVNAQDLILVGTQVSGTISELDADFNSQVKAGQILARIDPTSLRAVLDQARAVQAQAERQALAGTATADAALQTQQAAMRTEAADRAALASAQSQVDKSRAALALADLTLTRDRALLAQGYVAQNAVDTDVSNAAAAQAGLSAATLAVQQARYELEAQIQVVQSGASQARSAAQIAAADRAAVDAARAQVAQANDNLNHSVIVSPVAGTVVARNVSIGQTVAASFQTPTLFSIARDLTRMEIDIAVGEPDVGGARAGNAVGFTVLAYPNRVFHATVYQVRQNPTTVNNVVTYDAVVYERNTDGALRPGMTANASIEVARAANALVVPVEALQYAPANADRRPRPNASAAPTSPWGATEVSVSRTVVAGRNGRVFVAQGRTLTAIPVRITLVGGTQAAVEPVRGSLSAGDAVVVADTTNATAATPPPQRPPIGTNRGLR